MSKKILVIIIVIVVVLVILGAWLLFWGPLKSATSNTSKNIMGYGAAGSMQIQGMKIEILKQGTGPAAKDGENITVNYVGTLTNGQKFDSSIDRNAPFSFTLGQGKVIKGWDLGVVGMKVGEERKLTIPPALAYGANGFPPIIPKNATLIFTIDLLKIN